MKSNETLQTKQRAQVLDKILWYLVVAAIVVQVVVIVFSHMHDSDLFEIAASLVTVLLTFFVSYVITQHFARKSARADLADLAEAAGSRIFLISAQMKELGDEITGFEPDGDRSALFFDSTVSQLAKLASQAELSFEDLQRIAKVDISGRAIRDQVETRMEQSSRRETVPCPFCEQEKELLVSLSSGSTKHTRCDSCRRPFRVHRVRDGHIKIGYDDLVTIMCPNSKCLNEIHARRNSSDWGIIVRNCYECYARIKYDLDVNEVREYEMGSPLDLPRDRILQGKAECPSCGYVIEFKGATNSRGEELQTCPRCTELICVREMMKTQQPAVGDAGKPRA